MGQRVVFVETRRCALTGEEFAPKVPWQKYAEPNARRKAHRASLTKLRQQLAGMAAKLDKADLISSDLAGKVAKLQQQVRGLGAVPAA